MTETRTIENFQRVEWKYRMTKEQQAEFMRRAADHLKEDLYFKYTVHSVYYDTMDSRLIINSLNKPNYKMKLRLRSYGEPDGNSPVFIETKKKYGDIVYKRRITLGEKEAENYLEYGIPHHVHNNTADEIDYILKYYNPSAKVLICYDRECYSSTTEADVRITFDSNIRYRIHDVNLHEDGSEEKLDDDGMVMMEVKAMDRYPMWLVRILSDMKLYRTSFSKYGNIYRSNFEEMSPVSEPDQTVRKRTSEKERYVCSLPSLTH